MAGSARIWGRFYSSQNRGGLFWDAGCPRAWYCCTTGALRSHHCMHHCACSGCAPCTTRMRVCMGVHAMHAWAWASIRMVCVRCTYRCTYRCNTMRCTPQQHEKFHAAALLQGIVCDTTALVSVTRPLQEGLLYKAPCGKALLRPPAQKARPGGTPQGRSAGRCQGRLHRSDESSTGG